MNTIKVDNYTVAFGDYIDYSGLDEKVAEAINIMRENGFAVIAVHPESLANFGLDAHTVEQTAISALQATFGLSSDF